MFRYCAGIPCRNHHLVPAPTTAPEPGIVKARHRLLPFCRRTWQRLRHRIGSASRDTLVTVPSSESSLANIHLIGGEKGGVGKSLVSRVLAQYLIDHSLPFLGFDSDRSHGALLRFYSAYASPVIIDSYESLDAIVEAAVEQPDRRILIDLAAQTQQPLTRWMEESQLLEVADELGLNIRYWHVMDNGRDSVDLLKRLLDRHGSRMKYVLVLNQLRGEEFAMLDASGEKQRALDLGAQLITIKRLNEAAMSKIDAHSASFWAAKSGDKDLTGLGVLERQRVKGWLKNTYDELDKLGV
jgi:hypothetical protein